MNESHELTLGAWMVAMSLIAGEPVAGAAPRFGKARLRSLAALLSSEPHCELLCESAKAPEELEVVLHRDDQGESDGVGLDYSSQASAGQ